MHRSLNILTHSNSLEPLGGIELSTLQDCLAFAERGHDIDLYFGEEGALRHRYETADISLYGPVNFNFRLRHPVEDLATFLPTARSARRARPDVLWLKRFELILWGQTVARWSGTPIVCHLHHKPNSRLTSALSHGVQHYIAASNFMRDAWTEAGINAEDVTVVYNAIPVSEYPRGGVAERRAARELLGIDPEVPVVLFYGRMIEEKGVGTLLRAWDNLGKTRGDAVLVMVGTVDDERDPALSRRHHNAGLASTRWFPMQSDVIPFLHAADLVAFPTWMQEGFGRVAIEAMLTGRPVIASRVGAVPEILSGPMSRFLVEPHDADELGAKILSLLDWREREPDLESGCVQWVLDRFPYDRHVNDVEDILVRFSR